MWTIAAAAAALYFLWPKLARASARSSPAPSGVPQDLWDLVQAAAAEKGVPAPILAGLVYTESRWNNAPNENSARCGVACIASSTCAAGVTQMKAGAVSDVGGDFSGICNPDNAITWSAEYLKRMYRKTGNWSDAVHAYNVGPGAFDRGARNPSYASSVLAQADAYGGGGAGVAGLGGKLRLFGPRVA